MNNKEIRWKQRFINLEKSFKLLERTIAIENLSEAEKGGLIQFYEICFELSWKTMKDYLESEGFDVKSPREAIKLAFQTGLVQDGELWIEALEARNMTSHIYDEDTINKIVEKIQTDNFKLLKKLYLFLKNINE